MSIFYAWYVEFFVTYGMSIFAQNERLRRKTDMLIQLVFQMSHCVAFLRITSLPFKNMDNNLKYTKVAKFQIVSDIHIENGKTLNGESVIVPSARNLIVAGDLGRCENMKLYRDAVAKLCSMFANVILVPGNHEYYCMDSKTRRSMAEIDSFLEGLNLEEEMSNLIVLNNQCVIVDNVLIFGSTFWSYCPHQYYQYTHLYDDKLQRVGCEKFNQMHLHAVCKTEQAIQYATKEKIPLLVVTHYAPSFHGTLDKKYTPDSSKPGLGNSKNYMYCSSSDHLVENSAVVAWVYGHTGYNGLDANKKLVTNQIDQSNGMANAVLSIRFKI
jgi:hypothetical protein